MPKTHKYGEFPLPVGWDMATDFDGKIYYIDHNKKETTWLDPRDRITKPQSFADCIGDELPLGWEESYDPNIGRYYINHIDQTTQLEDPRQEWKSVQEAMLREYLNAAQDVLEKKREMYDVKQQRLLLAQDEYNLLNTLAASRSSLCSSSSSINTRHDPDSLRADLVLAKERVRLLKQELNHITNDISYTQRGVDKLYSVEQKINSHQNGCYDISEVQAIRQEMLKVQKSLVSGEKVREELMQSLVQIKNELTRQQYNEDMVLSAASPFERICVASQTDLCADNMNSGARFAEMAKTKLQYSEWRKRIKQLQQQLADHVERIEPGKLESDKDRLLLIQEKEKLLSELRSISKKSKSQEEILSIQQSCKQLEEDLNNAYLATNQCIVNRLRLHEDKQILLDKLQEALKSTKMLEDRLKSFSSESTFSISSGSSLGSLSTASSKSALSFTDIYLDPLTVDPQLDVVDIHRVSQRLSHPSDFSLSPRSSLSIETPPASPMKYGDSQIKEEPTYANASDINAASGTDQQWDLNSKVLVCRQLQAKLDELELYPTNKYAAGPLSPIFEKPILLNLPQDMLSRSSSTSNTRSVSAAVSNESVAGDSGVFEASRAHLVRKELAQVQISLKYLKAESKLVVIIERASNLAALNLAENCQVYLRAALLPNSLQSIRTKYVTDFQKPVFGENFDVPISLSKILSKSLQISVISVTGQREEIVGTVQISLAEFNPDDAPTKWYNILSSRFMGYDTLEISGACKEESSDESTIISSQTSTLTRNQAPPPFEMPDQIAEELKEHLNLNDYVDEGEDEEDDEERMVCLSDEFDSHDEMTRKQVMLDMYMNNVKQSFVDKETNTECAFPPEKSRSRQTDNGQQASTSKDGNSIAGTIDERPVKRSQTFSPSAAASKGRYICRLNRSDSDSAMHFGVTPHPFQRGAVERRSLRFHTKAPKQVSKLHHTHIPRTSLDLELDLQAQHSKLDFLTDEIEKLKNLKETLEHARDNKDQKVAIWAMESEEFQRLVDRADPTRCPEEKRLQKLLLKTSKEIYKLRKTKVAKGSVDLISFKEKIAFFTRKGLTVPELPSELSVAEEDSNEDNDDDEIEEEDDEIIDDKEELSRGESLQLPLPLLSTPSSSQQHLIKNSENSLKNLNDPVPTIKAQSPPAYNDLMAATAIANNLANIQQAQTQTQTQTNNNTDLNSNEEEDNRFDYVIDRTYGVEV